MQEESIKENVELARLNQHLRSNSQGSSLLGEISVWLLLSHPEWFFFQLQGWSAGEVSIGSWLHSAHMERDFGRGGETTHSGGPKRYFLSVSSGNSPAIVTTADPGYSWRQSSFADSVDSTVSGSNSFSVQLWWKSEDNLQDSASPSEVWVPGIERSLLD